jgi:hypothetical protein
MCAPHALICECALICAQALFNVCIHFQIWGGVVKSILWLSFAQQKTPKTGKTAENCDHNIDPRESDGSFDFLLLIYVYMKFCFS